MTELEEKIQRAVNKVMETLKEIEPNQIIKDGDCIYFRGEKYQKVEQLEKNQSNLAIAVSNLLFRIEKLEQRLNKQEEREIIKENLKTSLQEMANGVVRPIDDVMKESKEELKEVDEGLKEAFRQAVKQGIVSSVEKKPQTLYELIENWWSDVFTSGCDWDAETCIDNLVDEISLWLPKYQSAAGSQNVYVECSVEGYNDCLNEIKRKLR